MSKKTRWILIALGIAACVTMVVIVAIVWFVVFGDSGVDPALPVYTTDQTDSTHPGYLRTTATCGKMVYVSDYDEHSLQLDDYYPNNVIGRSPFGGGKICSIPGEDPAAYIAVDEGSEMPAFGVYRNTQLPPFDWRHAKFRAMEYTGVIGITAHKRTTDPALIEDVVRTLSEGTPVTSPTLAVAKGSISNLDAVCLSSDQLPGMRYCPNVYKDSSGSVYLVESFETEIISTNQWMKVHWIPASPLFTQWLQTP
jgi:hypothetical protein